MKKLLLFILFPFIGFGQIKIGTDINGEKTTDLCGSSVSLSSDGTILAIGAAYNDGKGTDSGHVRVYKSVSGTWTQIGLDIDGEAAGDQSGWSVSLSSDGSILAIGAVHNRGKGSAAGSVRVYKNVSGTWTQIGSDIDGEAAGDNSGWSVSLSSDGNTLAIGAPYNTGNGNYSGSVRVYQNLMGIWTQIGLDIDGEAAGNVSGWSVSLSSDGTFLAIGAYGNDGSGVKSGSVRVYKNVSGTWTQIGSDIDGEAAGDQSGWSVSLSNDGSTVAIGAKFNGGNGANSGHVRVYKNILNTWIQIGVDIDGENYDDQSGWNVSLSNNGSTVAISAKNFDISGVTSGLVRVYNLTSVLSSDNFVLAYFYVYPNPSSELVTISLEKGFTLEKVNVYNTLGQLVKTENKNIISVNSLTKGSYFFEVITNKGKATKTIIVQ